MPHIAKALPTEDGMAIEKINELKQRIREALRSADFQKSALSLPEAKLAGAVVGLFKRRNIGVTLISVGPAAEAALAQYAAVWKSSPAGKHETNWFSLEHAKR
jgi:hypothetical protein